MDASNPYKVISRLNLEPISVQAMQLLPPGWIDESSLHLLGLALWAVDQGMMPEAGECMVVRLHRAQKKTPR